MVSDSVVYTLVLRIRTLHIIKCLVKGENYSKRDFIRMIKRVSRGTNVYERYLVVKNDLEEKEVVGIEECERLYECLKRLLGNVKRIV